MFENQDVRKQFLEAAASFTGLVCTKAEGGFGVGSKIWLMFGELYRWSRHSENGKIITGMDSRKKISTSFGAWRLETRQQIICSSTSNNDIGGPMDEGFLLLQGKTLQRIAITPLALDLELEFNDGLRFLIFCDQCKQRDEEVRKNYVLCYDEYLYVVGSNSIVTRS